MAPPKNAKLQPMKSSSKGHWEFQSAQDVTRFWDEHRLVPGRANGRQHHHEERFYLGLYLLALAVKDLLTYPFFIEQGDQHESPDFMFTWESGETTGFEVTRATEELFQREVSLAERASDETETTASGEAPGDMPSVLGRSNGAVDEPSSHDGTIIFGSPHGYAGDAPEQELCRLFRDAIEKKLSKLRDKKYRPASRYELLVFEHTPLPALDREKVLATMRPWVSALQQHKPAFRKTSLIWSLDLLYDLGGEGRIIRYIEPPDLDDPKSLQTFSERSAYAAWVSAERAVQEHRRMGRPVYSADDEGRIIKETPNGRFEVRLQEDGMEFVVKELPRE